VEIVDKAPGIFVEQELDALRVLRGDHKSHVMSLVHAPDDLRVVMHSTVSGDEFAILYFSSSVKESFSSLYAIVPKASLKRQVNAFTHQGFSRVEDAGSGSFLCV